MTAMTGETPADCCPHEPCCYCALGYHIHEQGTPDHKPHADPPERSEPPNREHPRSRPTPTRRHA
jgi:hypothetical protein